MRSLSPVQKPWKLILVKKLSSNGKRVFRYNLVIGTPEERVGCLVNQGITTCIGPFDIAFVINKDMFKVFHFVIFPTNPFWDCLTIQDVS